MDIGSARGTIGGSFLPARIRSSTACGNSSGADLHLRLHHLRLERLAPTDCVERFDFDVGFPRSDHRQFGIVCRDDHRQPVVRSKCLLAIAVEIP